MLFNPPKRAALILLGSNFNEIEETNWTFLRDLQKQGFSVDVYSLDKSFIKGDAPLNYEKDKIKVTRLNMDITSENIATRLIKIIDKDTSKFILIDSINFQTPLSPIYDLTVNELSKKFDLKDYLFFHYISPIAENPTVNGQPLSLSILKALKIDVAHFTDNLPKEPKYKAITNLLNNLSKLKDDAANNMFESFLAGIVPLNLAPEVRKEFKTWLHQQITSHVNLENLQHFVTDFKKNREKETISSVATNYRMGTRNDQT